MYVIEDLIPENEYIWDDFNNGSRNGSFFHSIKWKNVIMNSFFKKHHNFILYHKGDVVGICPFYISKIKYFKGLMSLPHSDYRNILIDKDHINKNLMNAIYNKCKNISKINNLSFILINSLDEKIFINFNKFNPSSYPNSGNMNINLEEFPPNKIWNEVFSSKNRQRKYIRRFENDGFEIKKIKYYKDLKIFYLFYKKNLEYINASPYDFSHFEYLWNNLTDKELIITLLKREEEIAGGLLSFFSSKFKSFYLRYFALNRSLPSRYSPTYYLFWDSIQRAYSMGCKKVCLGSTSSDKNNIHYRIKQKIGGTYEQSYNIFFPLSIWLKIIYKSYNIVNSARKYNKES
jgi:hypothetical protein